MRNFVLAGFFALGLVFISQPAFACASPDEPPPAAEVQRNLNCAVNGAPDLARIQLTETLKTEASRDHEIGLAGSRRYRLVVACEDACTGIGLTVTDAMSGQLLGESDGRGQTAVEFDLIDPASVKAVARMEKCPLEDGCKYGVGVYTVAVVRKG